MEQNKVTVRTSDMVDRGEVDPLLNFLENKGINKSQALAAIGYKNPNSVLSEINRVGLVKKIVKYALIGLIAEKKLRQDEASTFSFGLDFDETELAYDAVRRARKAYPQKEPQYLDLQEKLANHMTGISRKKLDRRTA